MTDVKLLLPEKTADLQPQQQGWLLLAQRKNNLFDNLQKAMSYIIAIHIPIIGLVLLPAFLPALPILLMPLHIVFMELIIDPVCSIAFESEGLTLTGKQT